MQKGKRYIGDAVYADFDGYGLILTTEDGLSATNTIYLEPEVISALFAYLEVQPTPVLHKEGDSE